MQLVLIFQDQMLVSKNSCKVLLILFLKFYEESIKKLQMKHGTSSILLNLKYSFLLIKCYKNFIICYYIRFLVLYYLKEYFIESFKEKLLENLYLVLKATSGFEQFINWFSIYNFY